MKIRRFQGDPTDISAQVDHSCTVCVRHTVSNPGQDGDIEHGSSAHVTSHSLRVCQNASAHSFCKVRRKCVLFRHRRVLLRHVVYTTSPKNKRLHVSPEKHEHVALLVVIPNTGFLQPGFGFVQFVGQWLCMFLCERLITQHLHWFCAICRTSIGHASVTSVDRSTPVLSDLHRRTNTPYVGVTIFSCGFFSKWTCGRAVAFTVQHRCCFVRQHNIHRVLAGMCWFCGIFQITFDLQTLMFNHLWTFGAA